MDCKSINLKTVHKLSSFIILICLFFHGCHMNGPAKLFTLRLPHKINDYPYIQAQKLCYWNVR